VFAIKAIMKQKPGFINGVFLGGSILIFAEAVRICEAPIGRIDHDMQDFNFLNSIWAVVLTMTTGK